MIPLPFPAVPDPVPALREAHERILTFTAGVVRVAALADASDGRVARAAHDAHRYFLDRLPIDTSYEDLSLAPRLRVVAPESRTLLDALARDHREIDACLASLLPLLAALAEGAALPDQGFRVATRELAGLVLPHIEREERDLWPLCARLTVADRVAIARELEDRPASRGAA